MDSFSHKARKRFGQNFLSDPGIIQRIVSSIAPKTDDNIVEIGPGKGAITELLLEVCPKLNVVELDRDLIPILLAQFAKYKDFKIHQADALKFDFSSLTDDGQQALRIVGNLPYNISTPLIFHLLSYHGTVKDMHFMLQKEVVERMAAVPGQKSYGRLGIMVQYYCQVENLFLVPPECFQPKPKVDSAIVRLKPYQELPHPARNVKLLERVVNVAFQQRRKTLRNGLKQLASAEQLDALNTDISVRAENLSVAEFVALSDELLELGVKI
ncbi:16S rRNA (adenine(1518)-N(6)/adenine(1519)-N(6))-dimethyltransferase RsmA [Pseudoteredinibacter isoporae]|uniref:Ribosomal RNA small subunit methyltransferase A n=1 Tax=Pseudoteredinibacter isoporae TaxID=570281 RepID=A0A7X0JS66_9GAMM|nr:16S rRNA (adenine1518-N6/adenine1519-N6)-dimethyltransferase [Pseudoteredinibacter isoporae]NHO86727.1 16S rRNA (adenine(1518)-N(6)/adenine(1519)-N(6))-dimethyltransferase RsmA [Pseudoteredinibacter isoporae]NIB24821.1 16S rRNA (adenine(1518)-N(6)/adenine(1519)-N(6))-dimethyltransferase RsmA [Pseudoteredinibacter isoporae]